MNPQSTKYMKDKTTITVDDNTMRSVFTEKLAGESLNDTIYRVFKFYKENKPVQRLKIPPMPEGEFLVKSSN